METVAPNVPPSVDTAAQAYQKLLEQYAALPQLWPSDANVPPEYRLPEGVDALMYATSDARMRIEAQLNVILPTGRWSQWKDELQRLAMLMPIPPGSLTQDADIALSQMAATHAVVCSHMTGLLHYFHNTVSPASPWRTALRRDVYGFLLDSHPVEQRVDVIRGQLVRLSWLMPPWVPNDSPEYAHCFDSQKALLRDFLEKLDHYHSGVFHGCNFPGGSKAAGIALQRQFLNEVLTALTPQHCSVLLSQELVARPDLPRWLGPHLRHAAERIAGAGESIFPTTPNFHRGTAGVLSARVRLPVLQPTFRVPSTPRTPSHVSQSGGPGHPQKRRRTQEPVPHGVPYGPWAQNPTGGHARIPQSPSPLNSQTLWEVEDEHVQDWEKYIG